jgi:hypothetical protein
MIFLIWRSVAVRESQESQLVAGAFSGSHVIAVRSVPMLAIAKIICDRVLPLAALGHFLEG